MSLNPRHCLKTMAQPLNIRLDYAVELAKDVEDFSAEDRLPRMRGESERKVFGEDNLL